MSKIIDYLEKLDLSEIEAKLYLALLESGPVTVRELARKIGISRTTSYPYIDLLIEKELIMKIVKGSHTLVSANNPEESLQQIIEQRTTTVKIIKEEFPEIVKTLKASLPQVKDTTENKIEYYKGKNSVKRIYEDALKGSELRLYANLTEMAKLLPLEINLFSDTLEKNKALKVFEIVADDPESVKQFDLDRTSQTGRYFYKFMPPHVGLTAACILLYDNKVAIINVREKVSSIVLYNADYYTNSKKLFDFNWETLPPSSRK